MGNGTLHCIFCLLWVYWKKMNFLNLKKILLPHHTILHSILKRTSFPRNIKCGIVPCRTRAHPGLAFWEREIPYEPSIPNENHHHRPTRRGLPMKPSTIGAILWEKSNQPKAICSGQFGRRAEADCGDGIANRLMRVALMVSIPWVSSQWNKRQWSVLISQ